MMTQLYDILAALCLPALLAAALLLRALRRSQATAAARADAQRQEIEALRTDRAALERTSCTDPLTGVWNYRYLQLPLDREIARCLRRPPRPDGSPGGQLALLLLEIEGFEQIRREHGYQRAGAVLRDLAQRLAMEFRQADTFGRYGGEEFLVLLPDTDAAGAEHAAERLRWTVRRHSLPLPSVPVNPAAGAAVPTGSAHPGNGLSATVGVASLPPEGAHAALLLRAAERALARARTAGRPSGQSARESADRPADHSGDRLADPPRDGSESHLSTSETPTSHGVHRPPAPSCELPMKTKGQV